MPGTLVLSRRENEAVVIEVGGEVITVFVAEIARGKIRLGFQAHQRVKIWRKELIDDGRVKQLREKPGGSTRADWATCGGDPPGT